MRRIAVLCGVLVGLTASRGWAATITTSSECHAGDATSSGPASCSAIQTMPPNANIFTPAQTDAKSDIVYRSGENGIAFGFGLSSNSLLGGYVIGNSTDPIFTSANSIATANVTLNGITQGPRRSGYAYYLISGGFTGQYGASSLNITLNGSTVGCGGSAYAACLQDGFIDVILGEPFTLTLSAMVSSLASRPQGFGNAGSLIDIHIEFLDVKQNNPLLSAGVPFVDTDIPEPGTLALIVSALAGLWCIRKRRSALLAIAAVAAVPYAGAATITTDVIPVHGTMAQVSGPDTWAFETFFYGNNFGANIGGGGRFYNSTCAFNSSANSPLSCGYGEAMMQYQSQTFSISGFSLNAMQDGPFTGALTGSAANGDILTVRIAGYVSHGPALITSGFLIANNMPGTLYVFSEVPEPGTLALFGPAFAGLCWISRRALS